MPDHPFHVAGGVFLGHSPARPEIDASFLSRPQAELPDWLKRPAPPAGASCGKFPTSSIARWSAAALQ